MSKVHVSYVYKVQISYTSKLLKVIFKTCNFAHTISTDLICCYNLIVARFMSENEEVEKKSPLNFKICVIEKGR